MQRIVDLVYGHAVHQLADGLSVAITASCKFYVSYYVALQVKRQGCRAHVVWFYSVSHDSTPPIVSSIKLAVAFASSPASFVLISRCPAAV